MLKNLFVREIERLMQYGTSDNSDQTILKSEEIEIVGRVIFVDWKVCHHFEKRCLKTCL